MECSPAQVILEHELQKSHVTSSSSSQKKNFTMYVKHIFTSLGLQINISIPANPLGQRLTTP